MRLLKRTYGLPPDVVLRFERKVERGRRGKVIERLMTEWLEEEQRAELRAAIVEGCREMSGVYSEIESEYHPLEEEVEHGGGRGD
jgi:hypothetical protein